MTRTITAIALALIAAPAAAQDMTPVHDEEGIGVIVENQQTSAHNKRTYTVETDAGPLVLTYDATPGGTAGGCCDDALEVYQAPDGYIARPGFLMLLEGDSVRIRLEKYLGG